MILVKVELWSAKTGKMTPLAAMTISNDGTGSQTEGNYTAKRLKKGTIQASSTGEVKGHKRKALSVWLLVAKAIAATARGEVLIIEEDTLQPTQEAKEQP